MRHLSGITSYNPAECVLTALAGTPVADIDAALARASASTCRSIPTHVRAGGTIGGTVASGLSGSGRYRYGGVRDFIIGARVVDGHGRLIASGGQVVKNAAGFLTAPRARRQRRTPRRHCRGDLQGVPASRGARHAARALRLDLTEALAAHERLRAAAMDLEALDLEVGAGRRRRHGVGAAGRRRRLPCRRGSRARRRCSRAPLAGARSTTTTRGCGAMRRSCTWSRRRHGRS